MTQNRTPAFTTSPPQGEPIIERPSTFWAKIKSVGANAEGSIGSATTAGSASTVNKSVVIVNACSPTGTNVATADLAVTVQQGLQAGVGDVILVCKPLDGTNQKIAGKNVPFLQLPLLPPGGARYQVLQKIDDNGTVGWDWPRIHDGTAGPPVPPDSSATGSFSGSA